MKLILSSFGLKIWDDLNFFKLNKLKMNSVTVIVGMSVSINIHRQFKKNHRNYNLY